MSELKFKGIHPVCNVLMDVACIDWMHNEVWFEQGTDVSYPVEDCDLRRYSGFTDKDGVELYDKDFVNVCFTTQSGEHLHDHVYKVVLDDLCGFELHFQELLWESYGYNQYHIKTRIQPTQFYANENGCTLYVTDSYDKEVSDDPVEYPFNDDLIPFSSQYIRKM